MTYGRQLDTDEDASKRGRGLLESFLESRIFFGIMMAGIIFWMMYAVISSWLDKAMVPLAISVLYVGYFMWVGSYTKFEKAFGRIIPSVCSTLLSVLTVVWGLGIILTSQKLTSMPFILLTGLMAVSVVFAVYRWYKL